MNMLLGFVVLVLSIPAGYVLKKVTSEEIEQGRPYFKLIWIISLIIATIFLFVEVNYNLKISIIFTLLFIANVAFINWKE